MKRYGVRFDRNAVSFFDRSDGTKIRFAVGRYEKAGKPELCDVKISDYCPIGCEFCYMDSTIFGKHCSVKNIEVIAREMGRAKVWEVALGGGETTSHPEFVRILKIFRDNGVVPNFTTKVPAAVRKFWPEIKDLIGGFAYSAETPAQIRSAAKLLRDVPKGKASLHYVMGLGDKESFKEYMRAADEVGWRVTLLGYKTSGRGKDVVPYPYNWWVKAVDELIAEGRCPSFSIDTPLADQYAGRMPVDDFMYHRHEGKFSVFIDAVEMKMGASSFENNESLVPFTQETWLSEFRKF